MPSTSPVPVTSTRHSSKMRLTRRVFPAPIFWPVKLRAAWAKASWAVETKPSILLAAVLPAMAMAPKELIELWMSTLEMEKEQP